VFRTIDPAMIEVTIRRPQAIKYQRIRRGSGNREDLSHPNDTSTGAQATTASAESPEKQFAGRDL
jgi:hypothetical protein